MSNHKTLVNELILSIKLLNPASSSTSSQGKVKSAQQIINKVFEIGKLQVDFSEEDKKDIGYWIPEACTAIGLCVNYTACGLVNDPLKSACKQRSAIQFLLDKFGDFPSEDKKTVRTKLEESDIGEIIKVCDHVIKKWTDNPDIPPLDPEDDYRVKIDIKGVPESHTWWPK